MKRWGGTWLRLAAVAALLTSVAITFNPRARTLLFAGRMPDEMTLAEARSERSPLLWIDARSDGDFVRAHVPGALPLNEDRWDEQIEAVVLRWRPGMRVVVYCSSTGCQASRRVADLLRQQYQFGDVWVLRSGWEAWKAKGSR